AEALAISEAALRHGAEQASVDALVAQARVERASGVAGQRHRSLAALEKAVRIRPASELRNEIAACLPLIDLRLARSWQTDLKPTSVLAFDTALNRYALADGAREISINSVGSNKAI